MTQRRSALGGLVWALVGGVGLVVAGCLDAGPMGGGETGPSSPESFCTIPEAQIFQGAPGKDAIPALTNPSFVGVGQAGSEYLAETDRVLGLLFGSQALAVPLNILWWHEIVNLEVAGIPVAITHCPLTGSSVVFDRAAVDGAEFGVSGLLYQNNLIMYDRTATESLWPQMLRGARCGDRTGSELDMLPILEVTWGAWKALHPDTRVASSFTGLSVDYGTNPYGDYDEPDNPTVFFPQDVDRRFPPKERALGIPSGSGGIVFPFSRLAEAGAVAAEEVFVGAPLVVFWNQEAQGAMAYRSVVNGEVATFQVVDGTILDDRTGSAWSLEGVAMGGPLQGERLEPVAEAFVAFWFAWPAFYPDLQVWSGS